ncbi:MAG: hypothetical protein NWE89_02870 [Candidatus Bathyarchaeota archaeon]|nr:hypothetical protein [Candidatus Bathyarchaeota archaeon]
MNQKKEAISPYFSSLILIVANDCWQTPSEIYQRIKSEMGVDFSLDPFIAEDNPLGTLYYYNEKDARGLIK